MKCCDRRTRSAATTIASTKRRGRRTPRELRARCRAAAVAAGDVEAVRSSDRAGSHAGPARAGRGVPGRVTRRAATCRWSRSNRRRCRAGTCAHRPIGWPRRVASGSTETQARRSARRRRRAGARRRHRPRPVDESRGRRRDRERLPSRRSRDARAADHRGVRELQPAACAFGGRSRASTCRSS